MTQDTFSVIFLEYRIKKYEHFLKVTFHGLIAAHLKDYFSARLLLLLVLWKPSTAIMASMSFDQILSVFRI